MSLTRDAIVEAMTGALRELNNLVDRHGWDQPCSLWAVRRDMHHDGLGLVLSFEVAVSTSVFATWEGRPPELLEMLADAAEHDKVGSGQNIFALVLVSEAWMVEGPEAIKAFEPQGLHKHPDRVEIRSIAAVDIAGFHYYHNIVRGTEERFEGATRRGESSDHADGYIYESLERLVNATLLE